ncbi:MAG TPA: methyltransferase [Pseudonocardia sp.]|nr:methyltransferase [Pseudonocardia sp.]
MTAQPAPTGGSYWSEADTRQLCAVEAADYIARLHAAVPVRATDRILDFGCGTGHAVQQLAAVVAAVGYWDAAEPMRRATAERTGRLGTVFPVDLARPCPLGAYGQFDLLLVNGVVQYMGRDELRRWMLRWRTLLSPGGRIVVSDIPAPATSAVGEVVATLRFAVRHRALARAVRDGVHEAHRHSRSREVGPTRWMPAEIVALANGSGLDAIVLAENLTRRTGRFSAVLDQARPLG